MSSLAVPKIDVRARLKVINWRKVHNVIIGDLWGADVSGAMMKGLDIVLCGIGGAFVLLIALVATTLPAELHALVWVGCAFLLALVVERPSWGFFIAFPLALMIVTVGAITLTAIHVGFPRAVLIPLNIVPMVVVIGVGAGMIFAREVVTMVITSFTGELPDTPDAPVKKQARGYIKGIRRQVKALAGIPALFGWWDFGYLPDGNVYLMPRKKYRQQLADNFSQIRDALQLEVELTERGNLIVHPKPEVVSDAQ